VVKQELIKQWKKDEQAIFSGWDFSYIKGKRMITEQPPWDYKRMAKKLLKKSKSVLDMETGGGELFSSFAPFPKHVVAFEGYKPNVPIARKRLQPLGAKVVEHRGPKLPFKNGEFDLVLNRHGAVNEKICKEVFRILKPEGIFLTQQVECKDMWDLKKVFKAPIKWPSITLRNTIRNLKKAGFKIDIAEQWEGKYTFQEVGALVYYLKAIPWVVEGFSVDTHLDYLKKLQERLEKKGKLTFSNRLFLVLAEK
jgi:SAM-dependent methyltransferase